MKWYKRLTLYLISAAVFAFSSWAWITWAHFPVWYVLACDVIIVLGVVWQVVDRRKHL